MAGDAAAAMTWSERAIDYCDEHGLAGVMGWFRVFRGWAIAELGRPDEAITDMAAAAAGSRAAGSRINIPLFDALLADVEARRGNLGRAHELIEDALAQGRENQLWVSDLHTRRAALLAAQGLDRHAAAAEALRTAMAIAESQGAVFFGRRAAAALARIAPAAAPAAHHQPSNLSSRERELLGLVGGGLTDKEIAASLVISLATVRSHLDRIRDKTGCRRRPELIRLADELGLTGA
jgi:DNA-binding NarL/FixJ family response regulator